jgi:type VI secretion system protein VasD
MMRILRVVGIGLSLAALASLGGCSSSPPKPQAIKMNIAVSADVNPDAGNRPSPIVIRVYQLKDDAAFKDADFFTIYDKEQPTLAAALVSREEFELAPGEHRAIDYKLSPDAHFVGVVAAYRDIRDAGWRAEIGAPDKRMINTVKKNKIGIAVERARVSFPAE